MKKIKFLKDCGGIKKPILEQFNFKKHQTKKHSVQQKTNKKKAKHDHH